MALERRRVIRESTRKATSTSYKVNLESRKNDEDVHVVITHESIPSFKKEYLFKANQLQGKKSIHFRWDRKKVEWESNLEFGSDTTSNAFIPAYQKTENISQRDEQYVIDLCDRVLKHKASRQYRFDFLCGDTGVKLPVDAYYKDLNLVVEYYEKQHTESVKIFNRMTISGVSRDEQRRIYDEGRKEVLPQHGINVVVISYSDFKFDSRMRIIRNEKEDLEIVCSKLEKYLK